jgi:hypothetical protein
VHPHALRRQSSHLRNDCAGLHTQLVTLRQEFAACQAELAGTKEQLAARTAAWAAEKEELLTTHQEEVAGLRKVRGAPIAAHKWYTTIDVVSSNAHMSSLKPKSSGW